MKPSTRHDFIRPLAASLFLAFAPQATADSADTDAFFADVPDSHALTHLALDAKRMTNQTHVFTTVPDDLDGLPAVIPHRGPSTSQPGPAYEVTLTQPAALFLAVHHRGRPTVPDEWKPTGLTIGWGNHEDDVYARIAEPGTVRVPAHDGRAGGFGVPHMLIASPDLERARRLIDSPIARRTAIYRPARVIAVLDDPEQPGLYGHPGDAIGFRLRVIPGSDGKLPDRLRVRLHHPHGGDPLTWQPDVDDRGHTKPLHATLHDVGFYPLTVDAGDAYDLRPFGGGLGIVPQPKPVSVTSPWGVMRVGKAPFEAPLARMLGVDWVRHSNWNMVRPTTDGIDPGEYKRLAEAYDAEGVHIMASISLVPPALSSRPGETAQSGDAGPLESRVAPRDWDEWQTFMRDTAAALPMIDYWEIGNEPNTPHHYWAGTVEEFTELLKRSADGIREANPDATLLTAGFTLNPDAGPFLDRMLELGAGPYFDILTVHSLYAKALSVDDMRDILAKHGLDRDMPVWSTEPKHVLPMRNFETGVERNMHFMLVNPGAYGAFQALAERDGAATHWGVAYAVAADTIGDARFVEMIPTGLPDVEVARFERPGPDPHASLIETLIVVSAPQGPRGSGLRLDIKGHPGGPPRYQELSGAWQSAAAQPGSAEDFILPLDRSGVLHTTMGVDVLGVVVGEDAGDAGVEVVANEATLRGGFVPRSEEDRPHYAVVYRSAQQAGDTRPAVVFPFTIDEPGTHEFFVSAMWYPSHTGNLVSPFSWSIDGKRPQRAPAETSLHWRRSTRDHLRFGELAAPPTPDAGVTSSHTMAKLGTVRNLAAGDHTLTLQLEGPRAHDRHYSMEVEFVAARRIEDDRE